MKWKQPKVYAACHKNEDVRAASRSGGIFTAVTDYILEQGGIVYGCVLDEDWKAVHIRTESKEVRNSMRGSKYIQSKLKDTYKNVKADLNDGRKVLFSGTSCQVAGLKSFLGKENQNLFCIDIVCHGVPSPKIWGEYLKWQEKRNKDTIVSIDFRNKKDFGWRAHIETIIFSRGRKTSSGIFKTLFYSHEILRPSCYECPFKSIMHPGEMTIADYWGIEKAAPEFDDNKGVSLVLVNGDEGNKMFETVRDSLKWKDTSIEKSMQPPLESPFPKPDHRESFWEDYQKKGITYVVKKYGGYGLMNKLKRRLKKIERKLEEK